MAGLVGVPIILLLLGILQAAQFDYAKGLRDRVNHSYETRLRIERFLSIHQDLETGQRGYIVTGRPEFLEPYVAARKRIGPEFEGLRSIVAEEPEFSTALGELADLNRDRLAYAQSTVELRQSGRTEAAMQWVRSGEGKALMDRIRSVLSRMDAIERSHLREAEAAASESRRSTQAITFGLEALLLLLLGSAAWAVARAQKATQRAIGRLRDLSARQEAIFNASSDGMITHDPQGVIESLNPAVARMYGYDADQLVGRSITIFFDQPPTQEEIDSHLTRIANQVDDRTPRPLEVTARRHDGSTFTVDVVTSAVPLGDGLHFVAVIRDVTARKRVDKMKTEFVSTVSHELRTPLTSIAGSLGLLSAGAAGPLPERAGKLIKIAHANSERLVRLINDILDIEKIESGKMNFVTRPVPLHPLVEQAIQANIAFAEGYGVRLTLADGASGEATALADADRLMQVLTNLLSNASKFSPEGSEVVTTITAGETTHRITVRDEGPGIPKEFNDRIFSKFAQADASDTREKGGTGLGLSIVKQIVEGLGGSVSFDSEIGKGTAFHIDLPALFTPKKSDERHILICQEDMAAAEEIKETLRRAGFNGDVAPSCHDVRKFTAEKTYAAIILDLTLPGDQSISLIRDLRSDPRHASVPILVATSDGSSEISQAIAVVDWLHKPISADNLVKGVQKAIPEDDRPRILHVEDDIDILGIVASAFEERAILDSVTDLDEARIALRERYYDLVILDLALPGGSGLELLPVMHRDDGRPIPVVIFSAQDEDPELAKRVEALLTKSRASLDDLVGTVETLIAMYMKNSDKG